MLEKSLEQPRELTEKLLKLNVENMIHINQLEYMGTVIDQYA